MCIQCDKYHNASQLPQYVNSSKNAVTLVRITAPGLSYFCFGIQLPLPVFAQEYIPTARPEPNKTLSIIAVDAAAVIKLINIPFTPMKLFSNYNQYS